MRPHRCQRLVTSLDTVLGVHSVGTPGTQRDQTAICTALQQYKKDPQRQRIDHLQLNLSIRQGEIGNRPHPQDRHRHAHTDHRSLGRETMRSCFPVVVGL